MSGDLYRRLKQIKTRQQAAPRVVPTAGDGRIPGLEGWERVSPLVAVRETAEPLPAELAARCSSAARSSRLLEREVDVASLRFMDTETTGLSGGAGTTVFLVGAGRIERDRVVVRQTLLLDFPGEPEFLRVIAQDLASDVWVSYNGKAFDARLLESRFLMNGMPPLSPEHVDLLYWSRRLWRRAIGSCSLSDIEREILDRERYGDIPGIEIPERYFEFLRASSAEGLADVFEHHRLDIVSLVHLFFRVESVLDAPLDDRTVDLYQLGRWFLPRNEDLAIDLLEHVAGQERADDSVRAALLVSRVYRRRGVVEDALRVLELVPADDLAAAVERAKVHEHGLRDFAAARRAIEACLEARSEAPGPELAYRLERLGRKEARVTERRSAATADATATRGPAASAQAPSRRPKGTRTRRSPS